MPHAIFVRDCDGRPLLPMSPAYARKLLGAGKAYRLHVPPFTVIQLYHAIKTIPNHRVSAWIRWNRRGFRMLVTTQRQRDVRVILHIVSGYTLPGKRLLGAHRIIVLHALLRVLTTLLPIHQIFVTKPISRAAQSGLHRLQRIYPIQYVPDAWSSFPLDFIPHPNYVCIRSPPVSLRSSTRMYYRMVQISRSIFGMMTSSPNQILFPLCDPSGELVWVEREIFVHQLMHVFAPQRLMIIPIAAYDTFVLPNQHQV